MRLQVVMRTHVTTAFQCLTRRGPALHGRHFPARVGTPRLSTHPTSCLIRPCPFITTRGQTRALSVTSQGRQNVLLPDNSVLSPIPDVPIPTDVAFHQMIFDRCDVFQDLPALSDFLTGRTYTFSQVKDYSMRVASALSKKGYKKGDIILAFSPNQVDYTVLMLAASCLGVWFCAANPAFTPGDLARQISISDSTAIFAHEALSDVASQALELEKFPHKIQDKFVFGESPGYQPFQSLLEDDGKAFPDVPIDPLQDVFVLPYSSGTTGLPKGVMLSHYNIVANIIQISQSYRYKPEDNVVGILPLYHIYGMVVVQFGSLYNGSHLHLLPKFEPESFLACMQDRKIATANLVPPLILFLTKHPLVSKFDLTTLQSVLSAAAPLGKEITDAFMQRFDHRVTVQQGYGLTETSPVTNIDVGFNNGSIGSLLCNTQGKVVDVDTGELCSANQEGEVCVRGPQVMVGYYKNQAATNEMVTQDGWLHTGDIGYYNQDGVFYISGRLKELIKFKGNQVAPAELEALLLAHPEVADACVVGLPDEAAGELPKAFVVRKPNTGVDEESIVKFIDDQVTHFKRLRGGVEFIDEIPRNASGKTLRKVLTAR